MKALILQLLVLVTGIGILFFNHYWNRGPAVTASGIFFINIFWITMVLSYDLKIWSWLRNTKAGGLILLGIILVNLVLVVVLAALKNLFS